MKVKAGKKRIALVDDDPAVIESLEAELGKTFDVVARCQTGEEALEQVPALARAHFPHLVLLDIKMPGMGGIVCCRELRRLFPKLLIAMHTAKAAHERFEEARLAGADAYIVKACLPPGQLAATLVHIKRHLGQCLCVADCPSANRAVVESNRSSLTPMDHRIMELVEAGMMIKEMAVSLNRHEQTVKKHLRAIREKLNVRTNAQALQRWMAGLEGGLQM